MELRVAVTRFVDEHQPGFVECEFSDADGRAHRIVEKVPVVSQVDLDSASTYPQPGGVRCEVLAQWRDAQGRALLRISTQQPDGVETVAGQSEFVVLADQLV